MKKQNFSTKKVSFFTACDIIKAELEKEEQAKAQQAQQQACIRRAQTAAHCQLFNKISDAISNAVEDLINGEDISDEYLELVYEVEQTTDIFVTADTKPSEITAMVRTYLEITKQ